MKKTATSTRRVGYDAGKRLKDRKRFFLVDTLGNFLASCVVAASCHDGTTAAQVWDARALGNELLDQEQTVSSMGALVDVSASNWPSAASQCRCQWACWREGHFFIHAKRWVVKRSIAWAGTNRRLAKNYERKTTHANA